MDHSFDVTTAVREGEVLAGKYRVDRVLGVGAMGVVVAAHHLELDVKVAIKFLLPHMAAQPMASERFAREARASAKIANEHVARVLDVGKLDTGLPYIVMEYLEGDDLQTWLDRNGRPSVEQAVDVIIQACAGMADAHALGIVHRDLKPANLFCVPRGDGDLTVKVLDFGISKGPLAGSSTEMAVTQPSITLGSPLYMSPEQMESSGGVDGRADIWALGVILFELLTGRLPFEADTLPELCLKVTTRTAPPPRTLRPDLPEALNDIVVGCLQRDRALRCANVGDLAMALAPFGPAHTRLLTERIARRLNRTGASSDLPPALSVSQTQLSHTASSLPPLGHTTNVPARTRLAARLGVVIGALAVAGLAGFAVARRAPPVSGPSSPSVANAGVEVAAPSARGADDGAQPVTLVHNEDFSEMDALDGAPPRRGAAEAAQVRRAGTAAPSVSAQSAGRSNASGAPSLPGQPVPRAQGSPEDRTSAYEDRF